MRPRPLVSLAPLLAPLALLALLVACRKAPADGSAPTPPTVTEASADLLFTWIDAAGEGHVEQRAGDVPAAARDSVRVMDPAHDAPADEVWLADLRSAGPTGQYPVRSIPRAEWEAIARARRDGGALVARPAASVAPNASPSVVIYGASWCGPCHQAASYLEQRKVSFVLKDIEADGAAAREMQAKLAKAGRPGGSIPVIDVRGRILVGFDPQALAAALSAPL